ncbi:HsdM family class I SAM-dependent methyltransferase [Nocardioides dongxiaopingii]|uniref:HsdM family class I SAM-dependent methyltransferase n=1 Tax=Nocardioides dongxiaopingii TaxID=2576036 RepID=UPI0014851BED|nr:N-6 DNA methylase [Nocardioides dongxiaopingii]
MTATVGGLRGAVLAAESALGSRAAAWDAVLAVVADAHGLGRAPTGPADDVLAPWRDPAAAEQLGVVHESLLDDRGRSGSFYTPAPLVGWLLDRALGPVVDPAVDQVVDPVVAGWVPRVLDPACGTGNVLLAALRRLGPGAVDRVHGTDLDPVAVAITRLRLRLAVPDVEPAVLERAVRVADGLGAHPGAPYDAVVGNPPFLGQLRSRTAGRSSHQLGAAAGLGAYTDTSAAFLHHSLGLVRPGGVVALVQPLSLLAARDAGRVRAAVRERGAVTAFWTSTTPVFTGTPVRTCAPVVTVAAEQGLVPTWTGPGAVPGPDVVLPEGEWGALAAPALGVPAVRPRSAGVLGDLGSCHGDFRDQYYGLVPFVRDGGAGSPLVTSGLIDPARSRWGEAPTRFAKQAFGAPTVDLAALHADGALSAWVARRLVPKVLVATQGRVIEAVVDREGTWLPSVPVLSLSPPADRLWHALAVLLAPPVVALAAARYAGTALSVTSIKLSARQVADLPLPADTSAWDDAARLARLAQDAGDDVRHGALLAVAERMCEAYDDHRALAWWTGRLEARVRRPH